VGITAFGLAGRAAHASSAESGNTPGLFVIGDTVRGGESVTMEEAPFLACVQQNRFPQGSAIVFRMRAVDPVTGQQLTPAEASMTATFADGTVVPFGYHPLARGQSPDSAFILSWPVPEDYPTGSLGVTVTAEDRQGRSGTWMQFVAPTSVLQIVPKGAR